MIIQLDSNFRNYKEYPFESEFILPINNRPSDIKRLSDIRSVNLTRDYVRYFYKWVGNTSFNNPLSKVRNDTLEIRYIPIAPNKCIYIPEPKTIQFTERNDYFIGTVFWSELTNLSSTIIEYHANVMTMAENVFDVYFENLCPKDVQDSKMFELKGYVVNPSTHQKNNLLVLGSQSFIFAVQNVGIAKGINSNQIIENVTKNWSRKINKIEENRNIILENVPSYDSNDFFIIWNSDFKKRYKLENEPFVNGVQNFEIIESNSDFTKGDIVTFQDLSMEVVQVDYKGVIELLRIIYPGNNILEKFITLSDGTRQVKINVSTINNGVILNVNEFINIGNYMLCIISTNSNKVEYYVILDKKDNIIYLDISTVLIEILKESHKILDDNVYAYFIYFDNVLPNLNTPLIPYQNLVCVKMSILSISLPNLPVCGYNVRLADFPYLLLSVCNSNGQTCEIKQNLISNIPASQKSNFLLPIANVRNPELNFVSLRTNQVAFFKFSPRDSLLFRVFLPDGKLLKFNVFEPTQSFRFNCDPLTLPLNSYISTDNEPIRTPEGFITTPADPTIYPPKTNSKLVYPYVMEHGISIVLQFDFLV